MKTIIGIIGIMLASVMPVCGAEYSTPPLPQPAGATRVYTQWELHMRQVYRVDTDSNREFGDSGNGSTGASGEAAGGASAGDSGGGGNGSGGSGSGK